MSRPARQPIAEDRDPDERDQPRPEGPMRRLVRWWESPAALDVLLCLAFAIFAFWITRGLWPSPSTHAIADNVNDQALIEWFLAQGVLVWRGDFSFVTDRLNSPDGVNLMSNASHIMHGVIMAPVTALFGAPASFALLVGLNLAATATGWFLLLHRVLGLRRPAAFVAGAFAGFAPGMISQSNSHLHMTAQWLVPLIAYCVIRLTRVRTHRAVVGTGVGLGALVFGQVLLGEEVLFLTALTLFLFCLVYAIARWRWVQELAPRFLIGAGVAVVVAALLLAYPLWVQFRGPQHTPNAPFNPAAFYADLATFPLFSPLSVAGSDTPSTLATSSAEYNSFLSLPVLLLVIGLIIWLRRSAVTIALAVTIVIMGLLSFGPTVTVNGQPTHWPSLYAAIQGVPVINGALPTRYALALIPLIAILCAYGMDAALRSTSAARVVVPVAVVGAMLPSLPAPLAVAERAPVPQFIASGAWHQCAPDGGVIAPVPLPTPQQPDVMRWPAAANDAFGIPEGFFIGPYGPDGRSSIGIYPRPTSLLLAEVARTGVVPTVDDNTRNQARADLTYWKADCVALAHVPNETALHTTLDQLLGPGTAISDTWTWKVTR